MHEHKVHEMPLNQAGTLKLTHPGSIAQTLDGLTQSGVLADFGAISGTINQRGGALSQAGQMIDGPTSHISQTPAKLFQTGNFTDTPTTGSCLMGNAYPDGCPGAPAGAYSTTPGTGAGLYRNTAFFIYARQSGQSAYAVRPPWNVAGVDYSVGIPSNVALRDPTTSLPPNCTLNPTGSALGGPIINCGSFAHPPANIVINGYDFSLHNGVPLDITQVTGSVTISNCKFVTGPNISLLTGTVTGSMSGTTFTMTGLTSGSAPKIGDTLQNSQASGRGSPGFTVVVTAIPTPWNGTTGSYTINQSVSPATGAQTFYSGLTQNYMVNISDSRITSVTIENCYLDGDALNQPMQLTAMMVINTPNASLTVQYNAALRTANRFINGPGPGVLICQFNYHENLNRAWGAALHGEWIGDFISSGQTCPSQKYSFNTYLQGDNWGGENTSPIFLEVVPGGVITYAQVDHNTSVTNIDPSWPFNGGVTMAAAMMETPGGSGGGTLTNLSITENYVDHTGSFWSFANVSADFTNPPVWTGNINMVNGSAITTFGAN